MRIESISLENLNSLQGRWTIDLTDPCYAESGLFAITGPTGAGKSTLLDAVTLALYGRTPRLKTISKSDDQIMSHGAGRASASVIFTTPQGPDGRVAGSNPVAPAVAPTAPCSRRGRPSPGRSRPANGRASRAARARRASR